MRFTALVLAAAAHSALAVPHGPDGHVFSCAAPKPDAEHLKMTEQLAGDEAAAAVAGNITARQVINVDTYFHVVISGDGVPSGHITRTTVLAQLDVMNADFLPHGIQFVNRGVDFTINTTWANGDCDMAMKSALRQGTYQALNIYFVKELGDGSLGKCNFPRASPDSSVLTGDGCTVKFTTVPGGSEVNYNLGHTTTHQIGHWFGLYHTFENGCDGAGDMVDDTPAEAYASRTCDLGRDSCPGQPGRDPVRNYMNFSPDTCVTGFTAGQATRMVSNWNQFRVGK